MKRFPCPSVDKIVKVIKKKGYDLNLVGIRTSSIEANMFDDWLTVFYKFDDVWNFFAFPATTDPGSSTGRIHLTSKVLQS